MLPLALSKIFESKQRSYKMVLMLGILENLDLETGRADYPKVIDWVHTFFIDREANGESIDDPPHRASSWKDLSTTQVGQVMQTPLKALQKVLSREDGSTGWIAFHKEVWEQMTAQTIEELRDYALRELDKYKASKADTGVSFSLREHLHKIMENYLQAKREPFKEHPLGKFVRKTVPNDFCLLPYIHENIRVQGSVGQGNWAEVPWIAIMDRRITSTTQRGIYVCYLFADDMQSVYLTLMQGVTEAKRSLKRETLDYFKENIKMLQDMLPLTGFQKDDKIFLTSKGLGTAYQASVAAYVRYDRDNLPEDRQLFEDLQNLMENYQMYVEHVMGNQNAFELSDSHVKTVIHNIQNYIASRGFTYPKNLIENFYLSLKTKPFVILAGISGTGKTKLVKLFAEALGATSENGQFVLIPVRPDWNDPTDLLGYTDISGKFKPGRLTEVLLEASKEENRHKSYFVCLDEMNLARVEHYFSDLLSIMETQIWDEDEQRIVTEKVIPVSSLCDNDAEIYKDLCIPDNIFLIGTVNMDETTHPFSKKVLDRANSIEFNYINLNQLDGIRNSNSFPQNAQIHLDSSFLRSDYLTLNDASEYVDLIENTTLKLVQVNEVLEIIHAHVGFRVRDAICFFMIYNDRFKLIDENEAFDIQLCQKILPRIQGSSLAVKRVLVKLYLFAQSGKTNSSQENDWFHDSSPIYESLEKKDGFKEFLYPMSARKIAFMLRRFEEDGFTSFWLS
jgi:5-methylcytosine-specific restriction protein B